jgi:hypothetical protein
LARLFACDCAEQVLCHYENKYKKDKRPRMAIEIARKYAEGKATKEELAAAWAARDAARAAGVAWAAAWAAWDAAGAAWDAASAAAWDAASAAAGAATGAATGAAWDAAWAAAWAARDAAGEWQTQHLKIMLIEASPAEKP